MNIKPLLLLLLLVCISKSKASDTSIVTQLLHRIEQFQVKDDGVFPKGVFPSYRTYALNKDRQKADINPFFTGLIVFTLNRLKDKLTPYQQKLVEQMALHAKPSFAKFKNRKGRDTYNFWPTDTAQIFPNAGWMNLFNQSQSLPDDMDDTVIALLALNANKEIAANVHQLMQEYVNGKKGNIKNTIASISHLKAYSVWFGIKMPVDFDVSVLCNVLYFVQHYNLPMTAADTSSIQVLVNVLKDNHHLTSASIISPHYANPAMILYHLSRLMSIKPIEALESFKSKLIEQTIALQEQSPSFLHKVLLSTALLNWGVQPKSMIVQSNQNLTELIEDEAFSFFIANMASMLPGQLKKTFTTSGLGKFNYYCPAYNHVLVLENIILNQRYAQ